MNRPYKPSNIPGMMPYLVVKDPQTSIDYYTKMFGFKLEGEPMKQDGKIVHCEMSYLDTRIMFGPEGTYEGRTYQSPKSSGMSSHIGLYLYCKNVDELYERVKDLKGEILHGIDTKFYGDRNFEVADPDGYRWMFAQNVADFHP